MSSLTAHHEIVVLGGGSAGISVASRLRRRGHDVCVVDPAVTHYYQPLWTLVGGGCASMTESGRPQASVMPKGVSWVRSAAEVVSPERKVIVTDDGRELGYDRLVVCPGLQSDWDAIPGAHAALATPFASSNYVRDLVPKTWELIRNMRAGTAVFTMPSGPIKCAGAPQKIAYLACDHWDRQGVLGDIRVVLVLPLAAMFGIASFADELTRTAARYGIEVRLNSELSRIDPDGRRVTIVDRHADSSDTLTYDLLHVVAPQSAPDWIKDSPLSDPLNPGGWVDVDQHTLQHNRFPDIFALGDVGWTPNAKTGAAVRKQAPVVTENLTASLSGRPLPARYNGYGSCPLTTSRKTVLLAEFDYTATHTPSLPLIDTARSRRDMWYLKRYGLPFMYWNMMLKGRA
ncbi:MULTISPECIES: NAD(P)/FAD-dependent oxidoreductase [unclassified Rhodococcus (in: high G+C Gram-positive bacteria)]|uniref:NAD(P)/FAD-dependent oxidoreductase n=1 Tax=unclassified Rhodococcus (in: high G+C Gram-positive bacteria) TaxID=192944 RepID=UPI00094AB5EF|nr:FAD/NAD(P)-binding oxidoreductase [Rhodococcus sp. M8]OLL16076.1 pyridine nucleotide-disulfide oxidoreductase [Rhodococcus sp. M8]QPG48453.1 NAD(P)/FAD-dependent oxidoreductase [Rhodococcus sp. M8]